MALSKSSYGLVTTPRVYIDYVQYAKAIGFLGYNFNNSMDGDEDSIANQNLWGGDGTWKNPWDFNPANMKRFIVDNSNTDWSGDHLGFNQTFPSYGDNTYNNRPFANFMQTANYFAIFGHELQIAMGGDHVSEIELLCYGKDSDNVTVYAKAQNYFGIVGEQNFPGLGYTIIGFDGWNHDDRDRFEAYKIYISSTVENPWIGTVQGATEADWIDIGCTSVGRYMDFPVSPDLNVEQIYEYDGITSKRTIGGSDISDIRYHKRPDWGDFPAWFHHEMALTEDDPLTTTVDESGEIISDIRGNWWKEYDIKPVNQNSRRSWKIKFSYVDKENMFPKFTGSSLAAQYNDNNWSLGDLYDGVEHKESFVATFLNFTLGGKIPFVFQPNNEVQEFSFCKIKENSLSIRQVAFGAYSISMTFVETW